MPKVPRWTDRARNDRASRGQRWLAAVRCPTTRLMAGYVAACAAWVALVQPLLDAKGTALAETIGLVAFLGLTGSLLHRAFSAQMLQLTEARAAQLEAEEHLRAFIDHSPTRISFKDTKGRFLLVNRSFAEWFGVDPGTLPGRSLQHVFPPDLAARYDAMDREVGTSGKPREFYITHHRDGETRISSLIKFPVHTPDGQLAGLGTIASDVTEKIEAEDALRSAKEAADMANRAKSQFLAAMSHELRTPLNAIIGFSEMLAQSDGAKAKPGQVREYGEAIHHSGRHLLGIINDILDISRVEAGKLVLNEEAVVLRNVVEDAVQLVAARAAEGGVGLRIDLPEDCPKLWVDEQRLRQIVLNLVSNAVKFTTPGGVVQVTAACEPAFRIQIRDTGIGMREEDIPKALALFGQVDSRLQRSYEGTGLGLPLSKALVELHGGRLELQSRPGEGTTVSVELPPERLIRDASPRATDAPPVAERPRQGVEGLIAGA